MNSELTIVMTTCNSETTIQNCISSIIHLLNYGMHIIIVDDSSSDNTIDFISDFNHKNISVIKNNINIGVGRSKNIGINNVKTKYFSFIDSDDWCNKEYYINLFKYISNDKTVDAVRCCHVCVKNKTRIIKKMPINIFYKSIPTDLYIGDTNSQSMVDYPWMQNGIYKTEYITKNHIFMDETRSAEDRLFNWKLALSGGCIHAIPEYGYFYDKSPRSSSLTQCQEESRLDFIDAYTHIISYVRTFDVPQYTNKAVRQAIALFDFIFHDKKFFESKHQKNIFKKGHDFIQFLYPNELHFVYREVSSERRKMIKQLEDYHG